MAEEKQCVLVIVGADEYGRKELLAMTDGFRESTESWRELLLDLRRRGLKQDPKLAIGDGALGFWTALREVFATTREQRCWVHKAMNVLNALPKSLQEKPLHRRRDLFGLLFAMRVCIAKIRNQRFDGAHIDRVAGHLETGSVIYPLSRSWADGLRKSSPVGF